MILQSNIPLQLLRLQSKYVTKNTRYLWFQQMARQHSGALAYWSKFMWCRVYRQCRIFWIEQIIINISCTSSFSSPNHSFKVFQLNSRPPSIAFLLAIHMSSMEHVARQRVHLKIWKFSKKHLMMTSCLVYKTVS